MDIFIGIIVIWNIIVFLMFGMDKWKATKGKWRIKEKTLIVSAFLMGGLGAALGMSAFRHKTKHAKFKILVPLAFAFNIVITLGGIYLIRGYLLAF